MCAIPPVSLFLAPHYDDVALSCGGTVAALAAAGARPIVATVFGGDPREAALSAFARWQHERWGTDDAATVAARRVEERAAAAALGCETVALDHLDAIYRGEHYLSDEALFGPLAPPDISLIARIVADVADLLAPHPRPTLYVPLGVGNHVDHQIVYRVGRRIAARGVPVLAYEEFPYAILDDALAARLAVLAGEIGTAEFVPITRTLERKIAAIAAYGSQLPVIFRFTDDWRAAVEDWACQVGGERGPAERCWPLSACDHADSPWSV